MGKTILIATEKPFAKEAIEHIKKIIQSSEGFNLKLLENYVHQSEFKSAIRDVEALIVRSDKVTDSILSAAGELKIIARAGAGFDTIDIDSASKRGIVVMNTPGQNANAVAELAFGLMLGLIRNKYNGTPGTELKGKRIGMHGFGNIGKCMSVIAKGFNMEVFAYDISRGRDKMIGFDVQSCESAEELYQLCNIVSINIPANENTIGSINYDLLLKTQKEVLLVNCARKELINEEDLIRIMDERPDFMYATDFAPSRKEEMYKKYSMRTLFTSKKMGAQTTEANINAGIAAVNQIINYFKTGDSTFKVN